MGYGDTGRSPRQRGGRPVPPMRAWLTQLVTQPPHGRHHKAPPPPCALTTMMAVGNNTTASTEHGPRRNRKTGVRSRRIGRGAHYRDMAPLFGLVEQPPTNAVKTKAAMWTFPWMAHVHEPPTASAGNDMRFLPEQSEQPEKIRIIQQKTAESSR